MSTLKIVVGSVAVAGVALVGYRAARNYNRKRAEKKLHEAYEQFEAELKKHVGEGPIYDFYHGCR